MISRSCQDSRLHADAIPSSKDSCMSTDSRITIYEKPDGKKCAFECWLPDNNYYCQTAVKFRSAAGAGPTLSDMKWKRNLVHSRRCLVREVSICDANGAETDHAQSISQVTRSTGCGQPPSIHTRFSVHSRSYNSRPGKDISSRSSSSSASSYCSMVVAKDMLKYVTCENTRCKLIKPARRFTSFRTNSKRGTVRSRPDVDVSCSSNLPPARQQPAKCAGLRFNVHGKGSGYRSPADTLPVYHKNTINTNIQSTVAHIMTESLQAGTDVGEELSMPKSAALLPEEIHAMKTEHTNQGPPDAEWGKLWNNTPPSGVEKNVSVVKLRQMAGKLIESLICKIKLQLDAGTHPRTGELESATNENEADEHVEYRHCNETDEQSKSVTNDNKHLREEDDASESKDRRRHEAIEKHSLLAKEQTLKAVEDQAKILVNQDDNMQPIIIYRSTTEKNDGTRDQQRGLQNPSQLSTKSARSDKASLSLRTFDFQTGRRSESKQSIQENRGAHNDKSSLTSSTNAASDYEEGSVVWDEGKEEGEVGSDINFQTGRYRSIVDVIADMIVEKQELGMRKQLINNSNKNDYVKKTAAVKYRSDPPPPASESEPSSSSSTEEEIEPMSLVPSASLSLIQEYGSRLEVPGGTDAPSNIREPKSLSSDLSSSSSMKQESEPTSSVPSSSSSIKKVSEPTSSVPSSSSSIRKVPAPTSSVPSSSSSMNMKSDPKLEVVYNSWEAKSSVGNVKSLKATSSQSLLSTMGDLDETIDHATMTAEAEATLKSFATEVVQSLYTAIHYKLKDLVEDNKDEAKKREIMQRGDAELRNHILPTIIEHIVWIIKEEFRGQDEAKWRHAMKHDPGQYLDTIVTNAVMKTHADRMRKRSLLKTFVVTSNFRQSTKWNL